MLFAPLVDLAVDPATRQGQALLEVIDFLAEHELPAQPYIVLHGSEVTAGAANLYWHLTQPCEDGTDLEQALRIRRTIGGLWDKQVVRDEDEPRVYLTQNLGRLRLTITTTVDCWPLD